MARLAILSVVILCVINCDCVQPRGFRGQCDRQLQSYIKEDLFIGKQTLYAVHKLTQGFCNCKAQQCPKPCQGRLIFSDTNQAGYQLAASSVFPHYPASSSILNTLRGDQRSCWAKANSDKHPWIQVNLRSPHKVMAVITQGRHVGEANQYVTKFTISYSTDYKTWTNYADNDKNTKQPKVFQGNKNQNDVKMNMFLKPFVAVYLRLHPTAWNWHCSLRWDVLACPV